MTPSLIGANADHKIIRKKNHKVIEKMERKIGTKKKFPPYSFCSNNVFTDDDIIKVWLPKKEEIQNSKFQKNQFVYKMLIFFAYTLTYFPISSNTLHSLQIK